MRQLRQRNAIAAIFALVTLCFGLLYQSVAEAIFYPSNSYPDTSLTTSSVNPNALPLRELYTKPSEKYLYTASWEETDAARKIHGFTLATNEPMGYLLTHQATDTLPLYRLKYKPTGSRLVTVDQGEINVLIRTGNWVNEGRLGFVYTTQKPDTIRINRYSNGKGWRLATSTPTGYRLDGMVGFIPKQHYKVGAYYFGMFNYEGSSSIRAGSRAVYGRDDWWGGVKDFYGQEPGVVQDTRGWTGDFSHLKPSIGYYDNSDPAVLEQHIDQATARGLSYFNFYYYWSNVEKRPTIDGGLKAFLAATNRQKMEFTVSPCYHQYGANDKLGLKPVDFQTAASYIADLTAESNFLKTQSGRPLIFMCDTRGIDNGNIASANQYVALLKSTIKQKTGKDPFIAQHSEYGSTYVKQLSGDGLTCLNHGTAIVQKSYQTYLNNLKSYFSTFDAQRPTWRCAMANFDEKPRTDIAITDRSKIRYFQDFDVTKFSTALRLTKESMVAGPASEIDNYLTMYAWNEWHEGGIIEPNVRDGDLYLRKLQETFGL